MVISVDPVMMGEARSLVMVSVEMTGNTVEWAEPGLSIPLEEITSVLETSAVAPVFTSGRTVFDSVYELVSLEGLVSFTPGVEEELVSISVFVSEKPGIEVETVVSPMMEVVIIGDMALDGSESMGTKERDSCLELVVPTLDTPVFVESWIFSLSVMASELALLKLGGELAPVSKLVTNMPVVFTSPEVGTEDTDKEDEGLCLCNVEETREVEVMAGIGAREGELVSSPERGLVHDIFLGSVFMSVVASECVKL